MNWTEHVTIPARFNGPPSSANGGYACGVTAAVLGDAPAEVTLHRPPPLERALRVSWRDASVELYDGDDLVAQARTVAEAPRTVPPVPLDEALEAAAGFDVAAYAAHHPFPTCVGCGPAREEGDGLRIFPGRIGRAGTLVWPWTPSPTLAGPDGLLPPQVAWLALDCISGWTWASPQGERPMLLGRMVAAVHGRPAPEEPLVVAGWRLTAEGRKFEAGAAIWSPDGALVAAGRALWIELSQAQHARFSASQEGAESG